MFLLRPFIIAILACASLCVSHAQENTTLPLDTAVRTGRLDNGLRYFVRENAKPRGRAELRLVVNAGSVLEQPDQQGLAHFVEHMAFNGTRRFAKQEIVNYLESIGMRFGPDLNAYTSFDETVYMLQIPTDSAGVLQRGLDILAEWAGGIAFDSLEIERERGVVIEEWRGGRGVEARVRDKQFPILLRGSQYASRLPIGRTDVLDTFRHDRLRAFYRDWYRPELMAVIAVGAFNADSVEEMIRQRFSGLRNPSGAPVRDLFDVPTHDETLVSIVTDPEATRLNVSIYHKHPPTSLRTIADYRASVERSLFTSMLNQRLYERTQQARPPFLGAYASYSGYTPTADMFVIGASLDEAGITEGIAALVAEAERAKRFGFTATELEREKSELLRAYERAYVERDQTESASLASELVGLVTDGVAAPGIEFEYALVREMLPQISLDDINRLPALLATQRNRVVTMSAPQKPGLAVPSESVLLAVIDSASRLELTPYAEEVSTLPLVAEPPNPGRVIDEKKDAKLGIVRWTLSNGSTVVLKPTDFKNDEIFLTGFSPGGHSLVPDNEYVDAAMATAVATEGGVAEHSRIALQKMLAGRVAGAYPYISELHEGVNGSASPRDVATMFELVHLYLTKPRFDSVAFVSMRTRSKAAIRNRAARPESAFSDTLSAILSQYHPRRLPFAESTYDLIDPERSMRIYRERFADVSDFTYVIVGSFEPDSIRPLVERYLASLPARGRRENWRDLGIIPPRGVIERAIHRGAEPKARVQLVYTGEFDWNRPNRHAIYAMEGVLEIMLREALREEKGGTYGVGVSAVPVEDPRNRYSVLVAFGCAPDRVDELLAVTHATIDSLKTHGPSEANLAKVREASRRETEVNLRDNRYWLGQLQFHLMHDEPLENILTGAAEFERVPVEAVRAAARRYLDASNLVKVILLPETPAHE